MVHYRQRCLRIVLFKPTLLFETYNIYYKAVHPNNNKPTFDINSDAYNLISTYHKDVPAPS